MANSICILGGSGFVGTWLASELAGRGNIVRVPTRHKSLKHPLVSVQGIELCQADVHEPETLRSLFTGCCAVINLVGILNENVSDGSGFRRAHVELSSKVVRACKDSAVTRLLHMSALHADAIKGPSYYLQTKGEAEDLVMQAQQHDLNISCFRPSVIFGQGDSFFNRFASLLRFSPVFPLACPETRFAPVWVGDVVRAFITSLDSEETIGKRYNLCGPETYKLRELVEYAAKTCGMKRCIIGLGDTTSRLQARLLGLMPGKPMSYDNYLSLGIDSTCDETFPGIFGKPHTIEDVVPGYLCKKI